VLTIRRNSFGGICLYVCLYM